MFPIKTFVSEHRAANLLAGGGCQPLRAVGEYSAFTHKCPNQIPDDIDSSANSSETTVSISAFSISS